MPAPLPVTYSTLSTEALAAWLEAGYEIGAVAACRFLHRGLNDSYLVETARGRYVLRVYRVDWRTADEIAYEMAVLEHLGRKRVPVALPVRRRDGAVVDWVSAPEGSRAAVLLTHAPGREPDGSDEDCRRYGRAVAAVHAATDDFDTGHVRFGLDLDHLLMEPMAAIRPFLRHRPADLDTVETIVATLARRIAALPAREVDRGFCHGDFHGDNAHIDGDTVTMFDFDCGGPSWRAYDIAVFRWRWGDDEAGDRRWAAFLEGYRALRPIGAMDLAAVPLFVAARAIWLRGLHATNTADWGRSWLNDAYWDRFMKGLREWQAKHLQECGAGRMPITATDTPVVARETVVADAPALSRPKL
ncbi:MAG TPA: phosphotransferase [Stellaceae bacterium]|nr:phosphotransferase [Stellaceae bacterium]